MNPTDANAIIGLLQQVGYQPTAAGFSPAFGPLAPAQQLQPGSAMLVGGTMFGGQIPSPQRFSLPGGAIGQVAGFAFEQYANSAGYTYMPRGSHMFDVTYGRNFEQGLMSAFREGIKIDEDRLARAIEKAFRATFGVTDPGRARYLSETIMGPMSMLGMGGSFLPGGSAADMARYTYLASRTLRDPSGAFTDGTFYPGAYRLGMSLDNSLGLVRAMGSYFAPGGVVNTRRTRGLGLGDIGELAAELSSNGLLISAATESDVNRLISKTGFSGLNVSDTDKNKLLGVARSLNIGKQLQSYAEVVGTMREILGDPSASVNTVFTQLQQMTGGNLQHLTPMEAERMLHRTKELARAANISMTAMMELTKDGATMARQTGMYAPIGATIAQNSAMWTVASQTAVPGNFMGRWSPDQEANFRRQATERGMGSERYIVSAQMLNLLDTLDLNGMSASQKQIAGNLRSRAMGLNFGFNNLTDAVNSLGELGVDSLTATSVLTSKSGLNSIRVKYPELMNAIPRLQADEIKNTIGLISRSLFNNNAAMGRSIAASGMSLEQVGNLVAQSFGGATNTMDERIAFLRSKGLNLPDTTIKQMYAVLNSSPAFSDLLKDLGMQSATELGNVLNNDKLNAMDALNSNVEMATQGRMLVRDSNIKFRGSTVDKIFGALGQGKGTNYRDLMMAAFGFVPHEDVIKSIGDDTVRMLQSDVRELQQGIAENDPAKIAAAQTRISQKMETMGRNLERNPNLDKVGAVSRIRQFVDAANLNKLGTIFGEGSGFARFNERERGSAIAQIRQSLDVMKDVTDADLNAMVSRDPSAATKLLANHIRYIRDDRENILSAIDAGDYSELNNPARRSLLGNADAISKELAASARRLSRDKNYDVAEKVEIYNKLSGAVAQLKNADNEADAAGAAKIIRDIMEEHGNVLFSVAENGQPVLDDNLKELLKSGRLSADPTAAPGVIDKKLDSDLSTIAGVLGDVVVEGRTGAQYLNAGKRLSKVQTDQINLVSGEAMDEEVEAVLAAGAVPGTPLVATNASTMQAFQLQKRQRMNRKLGDFKDVMHTKVDLFNKNRLTRAALSFLQDKDFFDTDGNITRSAEEAIKQLNTSDGTLDSAAYTKDIVAMQTLGRGYAAGGVEGLVKSMETLKDTEKNDVSPDKSDSSNRATIEIVDEDGNKLKTMQVVVNLENSQKGTEQAEEASAAANASVKTNAAVEMIDIKR